MVLQDGEGVLSLDTGDGDTRWPAGADRTNYAARQRHGMSTDPTDVRSVAVTAADVVAAYEASRQAGREAVLRVTPPFSGRMRARLHVSEVVPDEEAAAEADPAGEAAAPIEIPPGNLLGDVPPYPHPDDAEDELRADPEVTYTHERHRARHEDALEAWREAAGDSIVQSVSLETGRVRHDVEVVVLGG
jgi:hypothetical protein